MKVNIAFVAIVCILTSLTAPDSSFAFRCGSRLISLGATRGEVIDKCGPPNWQDSWEEDRLERVSGIPYSPNGSFSGTRVPFVTIVRVTVEEWTYNFGSSYFMRILRFENNRLKKIETGGYGD